MMTGIGVTVVVPTWCEAPSILTVIADIHRHLPDAEIVIVDDDSPDGTAATAAGFGHPVRVLVRDGPRGLVGATLAGFAEAGPGAVIVMDGDGQHDASALGAVALGLEWGAGIVVVARAEIPDHFSPMRRLVLRSSRSLIHAALPATRGFADPGSGFYGLSAEVRGQLPSTLFTRGFKSILLAWPAAPRSGVRQVTARFKPRGAGASSLGLLVALCDLCLLVSAVVRYRQRQHKRRRQHRRHNQEVAKDDGLEE